MVRICSLDELAPGDARRVDLKPKPPIAVFRTEEGEVFALDDTCSHQDASLADGWVEDCRVECPLHASTFDLRTGNVDQPPAKRGVRAHTVTIEDGVIFVELSEEEPTLPPGVTYGDNA